ncbi:MAG: hypothetical protein R6X21_07090 [Candidatus Aminicenantes bacterium]
MLRRNDLIKTVRDITFTLISAVFVIGTLTAPGTAQPQGQPQPRPNVMPRTPLSQDILDLLANEISGTPGAGTAGAL